MKQTLWKRMTNYLMYRVKLFELTLRHLGLRLSEFYNQMAPVGS